MRHSEQPIRLKRFLALICIVFAIEALAAMPASAKRS
jgi:hypothetical protein